LFLLDQFEVVALRATDEQQPTARAVTMFLPAWRDPHRQSGLAMRCATTELVEARLAEAHVFGPLVTRGAIARLGPPTRDELAEVVQKPFEAGGAPLAGPAGALLQSSLDAFLRDTSAAGDVLPLISLQLTKLYDAIKENIEKLIRRAERLPESSSRNAMVRERDLARRIDFGAVINDVASSAVRSVRERLHVTAGDDELDGLFDRLVELGPPSSDAQGSHDRTLLLKRDRLPG